MCGVGTFMPESPADAIRVCQEARKRYFDVQGETAKIADCLQETRESEKLCVTSKTFAYPCAVRYSVGTRIGAPIRCSWDIRVTRRFLLLDSLSTEPAFRVLRNVNA